MVVQLNEPTGLEAESEDKDWCSESAVCVMQAAIGSWHQKKGNIKGKFDSLMRLRG
jgi:hypothetical protein